MAGRLCAHPQRQEVLTAARGGVLARWSLSAEGPSLVTTATGEQTKITALVTPAVAPDGATFAVPGPTATIEVRDWESLQVIRSLALLPDYLWGGEPEVAALAYAPTGQWLAVADSESRIYLLHAPTGHPQVPVEGGEWTGCLTFDHTSRLLASGLSFAGAGVVRLDRVEEHGYLTPLQEWEHGGDTLYQVAFSPQARWLAAFETYGVNNPDHFPVGWRGYVYIYALEAGTLHATVSIDATVTGDHRSMPSLRRAGRAVGLTNLLWLDDDHVLWGSTGGMVLTYRVSEKRLVRRVEVAADVAVKWLARDASGLIWAVLEGGQLLTIPSDEVL